MVTQKIDQKKSEFLGRKNLTCDTPTFAKDAYFGFKTQIGSA